MKANPRKAMPTTLKMKQRKKKMSKKWLDTGYLKAKPKEVDREKGIIKGVKVCSEGEASGHGFHVDAEFIRTQFAKLLYRLGIRISEDALGWRYGPMGFQQSKVIQEVHGIPTTTGGQ